MSLSDSSIAVVVPAFNEERLIESTIAAIPDFVDAIFVVDDASTDSTPNRLKQIVDPRMTVITHRSNTGVGGAVLDGHRAALEGGFDISVVMAGDGQMPPEFLPELLRPIIDGAADFAKGNRFFDKEALRTMPRTRRWGSILLSFLTRIATGYWHLFDSQNGYTAIRRSALTQLPLDRINKGYAFENSILIHLGIAGAVTTDVPIPAIYRDEVSTMKLGSASVQILRELVKGFWLRMWYTRVRTLWR